ncbi:hypothetical protein F5Y19DRAFT_416548 [Xylariaceae sp. FL1651]|nr:hypothetical protein F5Y19DRAFT_416548 [Xylariaceae sp. FL1651]
MSQYQGPYAPTYLSIKASPPRPRPTRDTSQRRRRLRPALFGWLTRALFKVRLSFHGYTLVAEGKERLDISSRKKHVPICLGRDSTPILIISNDALFSFFT